MAVKIKNRPAVGADRVEEVIETFGRGFDNQRNNPLAKESPAVHRIAIECGISISLARVICELSGIGGKGGTI